MFSAGLIACNFTKEFTLWEKELNTEAKSSPYCLEQRNNPERGQIGYINGIGTSLDQARFDAYCFSDNLASKHNICGIYSTTHGYATDLYVSLQAQNGIISEPVKLLLEQWNDFFLKHNKNERYLQLCMSQGVIMVDLALSLLPTNLRERICVLAFAPACIIPNFENCQVIHFIKKEDTVPNALALNRNLITVDNPSVMLVDSDPDNHPHDPHGPSYVKAAIPYVKSYLQENKLF